VHLQTGGRGYGGGVRKKLPQKVSDGKRSLSVIHVSIISQLVNYFKGTVLRVDLAFSFRPKERTQLVFNFLGAPLIL
jgi:hypothetical protein